MDRIYVFVSFTYIKPSASSSHMACSMIFILLFFIEDNKLLIDTIFLLEIVNIHQCSSFSLNSNSLINSLLRNSL